MNPILAIDPGTFESAVVLWIPNDQAIRSPVMLDNQNILTLLTTFYAHGGPEMYIECVASYGMAVGQEVFDTCIWIGRFMQAFSGPKSLVFRRHVKLHHCGSPQAKDGNIRTALIDKYGKPGTKKKPGLTYGLSADLWQAFALATYVSERQSLHLPVETHALNGLGHP